MFAFAFDEIYIKKEHKISIARISNYLNIKDSNKIKEKLLNMVKEKFVATGLFYCFETLTIVEDTIFYSYQENLLLLLYDPIIYAISSHILPIDFSTKYAVFLYEFCLYYKFCGINSDVLLIDFRNYLGINANRYDNFKVFENSILLPALYEINTKTELFVSIKREKVGNNIVWLCFNIKNFEKIFNTIKSPEFLDLYKNRGAFVLQNLALARYYKISTEAKNLVKQQYEDQVGMQHSSFNFIKYRDFIIKKFVAPFEMGIIDQITGSNKTDQEAGVLVF